jgi:hypothetical protein
LAVQGSGKLASSKAPREGAVKPNESDGGGTRSEGI